MGSVSKFPGVFDTRQQLKGAATATRRTLMEENRHRVLHLSIPVGGSLPPECHVHASKQILVLEGCAGLELPNSVHRILEGQEVKVDVGTFHRLENLGKIPLTYLEIRTGIYLADDDILEL